MKLSIVVPIYNEEQNIERLYHEIVGVFANQAKYTYELILVDDGSSDNSYAVIQELAAQNEDCKVIRLRRNYGQTAAMSAGFHHATGKVIVPMDGDGQNDPADIPKLADKLQEGFDVVSGMRAKRRDKFLTRRLPSMIANALISRMTKVHLHDYGCTMKAYRKEVLGQVNLYGELHRFVPALASQAGIRISELAVNHRPREAGESKYGLDRTFRVVLDLFTVKFLLKYSTRPMQLFGKWGFVSILGASLCGLATLYMKIVEDLSMNRNPLLILTAFLLFAGVQLFATGLLGELVTRTYHEVQNKPIYTIREKINF